MSESLGDLIVRLQADVSGLDPIPQAAEQLGSLDAVGEKVSDRLANLIPPEAQGNLKAYLMSLNQVDDATKAWAADLQQGIDDKFGSTITDEAAKAATLKQTLSDTAKASKELDDAIGASTVGFKTAEEMTSQQAAALDRAKQAYHDTANEVSKFGGALDDAFRSLGVKSSAELEKTATDAKASYEAIKNSGVASANDIQAAWIAMETARQTAAVSAGQKISAEDARALATAKKALDDQAAAYQSTFDKISAAASKISTPLIGVGTALTAAITAPLVGLGALASKSAIDFDEAFDHIRAATGKTGDALAGLEDTFKSVFANVPASAEQVSVAIADLNVRLGLTGPPLEALATQMLNLARLTGTQVGPLIQQTTRLFAEWGVATNDQAGTLDYLFKITQQTGIGIQKLATDLVQFGAPLKEMGFSLDQAAALIGKFEQSGINMQAALVGMRTALANFTKQGIDAATGFQSLIDGIKNTDQATALLVAQQVFGTRATAAWVDAIRSGRLDIDALVKSVNASSDTIGKANKDTLSFTEQLKIFGHQIDIALAPLGKSLVEAMENALAAAKPFVGVLQEAAEWFGRLGAPMQAVIIGLGGLFAIAGPLMLTLGGIAKGVGYFGDAIGALSNLLPAAVEGLGGLGSAAGALLGSLPALPALLGLLGAAIAGWAIYKAVTELEQLNAELDKFYALKSVGVQATPEQSSQIEALLAAIQAHNQSVGATQIKAPDFADFASAAQPIDAYTQALQKVVAGLDEYKGKAKEASTATKDGAIDITAAVGAYTDLGQAAKASGSSASQAAFDHLAAVAALKQAKTELANVQAAYKAGAASAADLATAQAKVTEALKALNPELHGTGVSAAEAAKMFEDAKQKYAAVTAAFFDGQASAEQLRAALEALGNASGLRGKDFETAAGAVQLLKAAHTELAAALQATVSPAVLSVADALAKESDAKQKVQADTAGLQQAEAALASMISGDAKPNAQALADAVGNLQVARKSLKDDMPALKLAEEDLSRAQADSEKVTRTLLEAENEYQAAIRKGSDEAVKPYVEALRDVKDAKASVLDAAGKLQDAEQALDAYYKGDGAKTQVQLRAYIDAVTQARTKLKGATTELATQEKSLADTEKVSKAASDQLLGADKDLQRAYDSLNPTVRSFHDELEDVRQKQEDTGNAADTLRDAEGRLRSMLASQSPDLQEVGKATADVREARVALSAAAANLHTAEQTLQTDYAVSAKALQNLRGAAGDVNVALTGLGIVPADQLQKFADAAQQKFSVIASAGTASAEQVREAHIKALEAITAAYQANGDEVPAAYQIQLAKLKQEEQDYISESVTRWSDLYSSLDTATKGAFTGLEGALAKNLVEWGNWADSIKSIGQKFAEDMISSFEKALFKPLEDKLASLVADLGTKIASGIGGLFGGGGGAAADAAGTATEAASGVAGEVAGGAESAVGAATSVVSSTVSGIVGALGSIAGAIGSVGSFIQGFHQSNLLGEIEVSTRENKTDVHGMRDMIDTYIPRLNDLAVIGQSIQASLFDPVASSMQMVEARVLLLIQHVDDHLDAANNWLQRISGQMADGFSSLKDAVSQASAGFSAIPAPALPPTQTGARAAGSIQSASRTGGGDTYYITGNTFRDKGDIDYLIAGLLQARTV